MPRSAPIAELRPVFGDQGLEHELDDELLDHPLGSVSPSLSSRIRALSRRDAHLRVKRRAGRRNRDVEDQVDLLVGPEPLSIGQRQAKVIERGRVTAL